jgi:hypothetical protein
LAVSVPLPLVEVWEELQPEVEHLTGLAGLQIIRAVIEDEVTRRVGPRYQPCDESGCRRWGQQPGYVVFSGQKVPVEPGDLLRRSLANNNPIESCLSTVERVAHNVKRRHAGDQALRWTATGLLEAEKKFSQGKRFPRTASSSAQTESRVDSAGSGRVTCSPARAATFNYARDNFSLVSVEA